MEITPLMIYVICILDKIIASSLCIICVTSSILIFSIVAFPIIVNIADNIKISVKRMLTIVIVSFILSSLVYTFIPSTKVAASMFLIPAIANNENIQQIGGNSLEILKKLTEQWLIDLNNNNTKELIKEPRMGEL